MYAFTHVGAHSHIRAHKWPHIYLSQLLHTRRLTLLIRKHVSMLSRLQTCEHALTILDMWACSQDCRHVSMLSRLQTCEHALKIIWRCIHKHTRTHIHTHTEYITCTHLHICTYIHDHTHTHKRTLCLKRGHTHCMILTHITTHLVSEGTRTYYNTHTHTHTPGVWWEGISNHYTNAEFESQSFLRRCPCDSPICDYTTNSCVSKPQIFATTRLCAQGMSYMTVATINTILLPDRHACC